MTKYEPMAVTSERETRMGFKKTGSFLICLSLFAVPVGATVESFLSQNRQSAIQYFKTSGFENLTSFEQAVEKDSGAFTKSILRALKTNRFEIVTRRHPDLRQKITDKGFLNAYQTGSSDGIFDLEQRRNAESFCLGLSRKEYETLPIADRPKYAYLSPEPRLEDVRDHGYPRSDFNYRYLKGSEEARIYGSDIYILKLNHLSQRLTFTLGDSLDNVRVMQNSFEQGKIKNKNAWPYADWPVKCFPYEYRSFLAPFFWSSRDAGGTCVQGDPLAIDYEGAVGLPQKGPQKYDGKIHSQVKGVFYNGDLAEVQVWGPLTLDDVETFEFTDVPPSGPFLDELLKRKISIRDGRQPERNLWR